MTDSTVNSDAVTEGILALLGSLSFAIGDGKAPEVPGNKYAVLYTLDDEDFDGPANDPWADVQHVYQITAVGTTRKQAEAVRDACRGVMLTGTLTITARSVMSVRPLGGGAIEREDDKPISLFYSTATYGVWTTPS